VDLAKCAHSRIGSDAGGGISGGERRRLSIGVEVVHKPRLLLLVRARIACVARAQRSHVSLRFAHTHAG
jgi:ABC-type lipopolysaccharide export system ATPase subunit